MTPTRESKPAELLAARIRDDVPADSSVAYWDRFEIRTAKAIQAAIDSALAERDAEVREMREAIVDQAKLFHVTVGYQKLGPQDPHYGDWDTCNSRLCRHAQAVLAKYPEPSR